MARLRITRENRRDYMLTEPMRRLVPAMALPTIMSAIISSLYNLADTYFVSQIGSGATAAVGINSSLDQLISITGSFFAMGASSYISRLIGAKNEKKAERVLATAFYTALAFGVVVLIIGKIFMVPLIRFLGATPDIEQYAMDYADYVLYAAPLMAAQLVLNNALRSEGSAAFAFVGLTLGGVLNCGLDPLFITTLGMGVKGASIATALSKLASFSILLSPYIRKKTMLHMSPKNVSYTKDIVSEIAKMGTPGLSRSSLQMVAGIVMNRIAGGQFSSSVLAAVSVTNRLVMTIRSASLGFSQGFQPIAGFCWGAKRYDRVLESYRFSSIAIVILVTIPCTIIFTFASYFITAFNKSSDPEMLRIGIIALRAQCITMPLNAWTIVVNSLYSAAGRASGALVISMTRQGICFMPLVFTLPRFFGVFGLLAVQPGAEILTIAVVIPLAVSMTRRIKRLQLEDSEQLGYIPYDIEKLEIS